MADKKYTIPSFGRRIGAYVIDGLIGLAIGGALAGWDIAAINSEKAGAIVLALVVGSIISIAWAIWYVAMKGSSTGTPGMQAFGTRLVDAEALVPIGFWRALGRGVIQGLSYSVVIGYFSPLFDRSGRGQGWHDIVVGSLMIDAPQATGEGAGGLDGFFKISERGSSIGTEVRGGLTTFFTMAYIVVLNPIILVGATSAAGAPLIGGGGDPIKAIAMVAAVTALVAGVMTILMGLIANFPLALAAGLGLNAFVAYGLVVAKGYTWPEAMGMIVIEGTVVLILVLTKFRIKVLYAVPLALKKAIAVGIGLFLAFIGLWDGGIVKAGSGTPTQFGDGGYIDKWPMVVFLVGLVTAIVLMARKVKGALLISIAFATVVAFVIEWLQPQKWSLVTPTFQGAHANFSPDLHLLGKVSVFGGFAGNGVAWKLILTGVLVVFSLLVVDFFDTIGTMTAVGEEGGLNDTDGIPEGSQQILIIDSAAAIAGGAASASSNTAYIESAAGVGDGARTGLASVVTGLAFIAAMFLTPLYQVVPFEAATPVLVVVGFLMVTMVGEIDWKDVRIAIPAFLTIIVMPFGYSISAGIGLGFISYVILSVAVGKAKEVKALMWVVAALFALYFAMGPIDQLVNH